MIGDANLELRTYAESQEGRNHPGAVTGFQRAMTKYIDAGELWRFKLSRPYNETIPTGSSVGKPYVASYPDVLKPAESGGAMFSSGRLYVDLVLPFIWRDAAGEVSRAIQQL